MGVTITDRNRSDAYENQKLLEEPSPGLYPGHFNLLIERVIL